MVVERGVQRLVVNFRRVAMFCAEPYRHIPFKRGPLDSFRYSLGTPETREQMIPFLGGLLALRQAKKP